MLAASDGVLVTAPENMPTTASSDWLKQDHGHRNPQTTEIGGMAIHNMPCVRAGEVVIAAAKHGDKLHSGAGADLLELDDVVVAVGSQAKLEELRDALGVQAPVRLRDPRQSEGGQRRCELHQVAGISSKIHFLDAYGVVITCVVRAGVELLADKALKAAVRRSPHLRR